MSNFSGKDLRNIKSNWYGLSCILYAASEKECLPVVFLEANSSIVAMTVAIGSKLVGPTGSIAFRDPQPRAFRSLNN